MPLGVIRIEVKDEIRAKGTLPHSGKWIFLPHGKSVALGRTGVEFWLKTGAKSGEFRFSTLPKNELIVEKELQVSESGKYDLHPYWFTLSVEEETTFCRRVEGNT